MDDHLASCTRAGGVQRRAKPLERAWQRVFREAGANVNDHRNKPLLRNLAIPGIASTDGRQLDILATGLSVYAPLPICADVTLRSPIDHAGAPHGRAANVDGATFRRACQDKEVKYPELHGPNGTGAGLCKFFTLAAETGGRFCNNSQRIIDQLAQHKSLNEPASLQRSAQLCYLRRWWGLLSVAVQVAVAATLVPETLFAPAEWGFVHTYALPNLEDLVGGHRVAPAVSRLPGN